MIDRVRNSAFLYLRLYLRIVIGGVAALLLTMPSSPQFQSQATAQSSPQSDIFLPVFSNGVAPQSATKSTTEGQVQAASLNRRVQAAALGDTGQWTNVIDLSLVPVGAANLPSGKVLFWSSNARLGFGGGNGQTYTSLFDPADNSATERLVTETGHDMFCPGTSNLADGRLMITDGSNNNKTSFYNFIDDSWTSGAGLNIGRGYHAQTVLGDGDVFTIGGSWSGGRGGKDGERWSQDSGWDLLSGVPVAPILDGITDPQGVYREDNHAWLWTAPNGKVFHAGPASNMHWLETAGNGSYSDAGPRGDDESSITGTTVMYDAGKILKVGGAPNYSSGGAANGRTYVIDINSNTASVRRVTDLAETRTMHNSVVLPNGEVLAIGGLATARAFSDTGARLTPELWNPDTEQWTSMSAMAVPRTYHSIALLLPDGRVMAGGGGLCGSCSVNHPDIEIFSPPYLFSGNSLAVRPDITSAPDSAGYGQTINVTTDSAVTAFSLIRHSSVTHGTNNDQRRLALTPVTVGTNRYDLTITDNPNVLLPGYYMLFAMNAAGTPSFSRTIKIDADQSVGNLTCSVLPTDVDYHIVARHSDKGMSVQNASTADSANIAQSTISGAASDNWQLRDAGQGFYNLVAQHSGKFASVESGSLANAASIVQSAESDAASAAWCFQSAGGGYYNIVSRSSGKNIDVSGASSADGANIIQWPQNGGANQDWKLVEVSEPVPVPTNTPTSTPTPAVGNPPAPTNTPTPTPNNPSQSGQPVYTDSIAAGWNAGAWGSVAYQVASSAQAYQGSSSLSVKYDGAYSTLYINRAQAISTANIEGLSLWVYGNASGSSNLRVATMDSSFVTSNKISFNNLSSGWQQLSISMSQLGNPSDILYILLENPLGSPQSTIYVDEIVLGSSSGGPPPAAPTPTPTPIPPAGPPPAAPTPTPTSTPAGPPTGQSGLSIYADTLAAGWNNGAWGNITKNLSSSTPVQAGSSAIQVKYNESWGTFYLQSAQSLNPAQYDSLAFWVYGEAGGSSTVNVAIMNSAYQTSFRATLTDLVSGWQFVRIPLADLGPLTDILFILIDNPKVTAQPALYFDEIVLESSTSTGNRVRARNIRIDRSPPSAAPIINGRQTRPMIDTSANLNQNNDTIEDQDLQQQKQYLPLLFQ